MADRNNQNRDEERYGQERGDRDETWEYGQSGMDVEDREEDER